MDQCDDQQQSPWLCFVRNFIRSTSTYGTCSTFFRTYSVRFFGNNAATDAATPIIISYYYIRARAEHQQPEDSQCDSIQYYYPLSTRTKLASDQQQNRRIDSPGHTANLPAQQEPESTAASLPSLGATSFHLGRSSASSDFRILAVLLDSTEILVDSP